MSTSEPQPARPGSRRIFAALAATLGWLAGGALLLLAALLLSTWLWSGQAQSLPHTLNWLQDWLTDADGVMPLQVQGASGTLREGGHIDRLRWRRDGLELELDGLELSWPTEVWTRLALQRELRLDRLAVERLRLRDARPATPDTPPPQDLRLPWLESVRLPLQAGGVTVEIGTAPALRLGSLRADYGYGPDGQGESGHKLQIDTLRWAQGDYQLQARLQAGGELALDVELQGQVEAAVPGGRPQALGASAHLSGKLAGAQAALELAASVSPQASVPARDGARLKASATIRPWSRQPLPQAKLELQGIDLAAFWPQAPNTRLQGHWEIENAEQDPAGHALWRLAGELRNTAAGAWDRRALPIERLRAELALSDGRWQLKALDAQLPGSGRLQAGGELDRTALWTRPGAWQGRLTARLPEPRALLTRLALAPLTLQARVAPQGGREAAFELALTSDGQSASATARPAPRLQATGGWDGERLRLERAELDVLDASLKASGTLRPSTAALAGELALELPGASLKAQLRANGGQAELAANDMEHLQHWLQTSLGRIERLWPGSKPTQQLSEALARAALDGQTRIEASWDGSLRPDRLPPRWSARAQVAQGQIVWPAASGTPPLRIADARLALDGDAGRITLALDGQARSGDWTLSPTLRARGELGQAGQAAEWLIEQAELRASDATRSLSGRLTTPGGTRLAWSADQTLRLAPGQAVVALPLRDGARAATEIRWDETRWSGGLLESSGRASGLELAWLDALLASPAAPNGPLAQAGLTGEVELQGHWELRLPLLGASTGAQPARARLELARSGGDLRLLLPESAGGQPQPIGLEQASASLALDGSRLQGRLRWSSRLAGQLSADFGTELAPPSPASPSWSWPAEAPLSGRLQATLPQLGLWSSFAPPGWRMRGSVRADASLGGSRHQPEWRGTLHAGELALRSLIDGIDFSDGELDATLDGETLKLDRLRLRGAGGASGGLLLGKGLLRWSRPASAPGQPVAALEPALTLDLQAQTLRLLARADRRLTLSGKVAARLDGRRLDVSGRLQADQALFLLPDEDKPELGDDVVVRGQAQPARAQAAAPLQTRLRLELALGDNFHLRGQGLDTDLKGELLLSANPGQATPQLTGQIRTERGSFRAWGQTLEIEAGVLSFNGPYDNPGLDILALRPLSGQRIGVQLGGNALAPRLRLYADPELPESEKLAWLVLGRPASGAGSEAALLQQAALALLSGRGRAADGGLTRALGLDELSLRGETQKADGSTSAAALTLGKRISRQLYLSYTRSVIGATGTVAVLYDLTRNFTVRAQAGDDNALDLIFTRQYDGGPARKR